MTQKQIDNIALSLSSLCVFRKILDNPSVSAFYDFVSSHGELSERLSLYACFVATLDGGEKSFSDVICDAMCEDENAYVTKRARGETVSRALEENVRSELEILTSLTRINTADIRHLLGHAGYLPAFVNETKSLASIYDERVENIGKYGYGIFASHTMFRVEDGEIVPVTTADKISTENFVGYESEREQVLENTKALAEGRYAANVLLCGDAGTGKSSTVKAAANRFFSEGVRLIELRKDQLFSLPSVMERIMHNPLKFIIFIDDLSFNKNDDCFSMLKAALEGSSSAKAQNAAIYVTSNRRHIIKETFADRGDDDIHRADTVEELMSLSGRFGLVVYFGKPSKQLYLTIVHELAERYGITVPQPELDVRAEAFALAKGSRSPRCAEQFVKSLL